MITDYGQIKGIVLSYPSGFLDPYYRQLTRFYDELISLIPTKLELTLVINSSKAENEVLQKFKGRLIKFILISDFNEIWLRDLLGFSNNNGVIRPIFRPSYFKNIYTNSYLSILNSQIDQIIDKLGFEKLSVDLIWDGGNLIHNNKIGFVTDKLLLDNPGKTKSEIEKIISSSLGLKAIFVPTFKYDQLGHMDGYLNFIDENTVTLSQYPQSPFFKESRRYRESISAIVRQEELTIIDIWDCPNDNKLKVGNDFLESAEGIQNNFLQINKTLILPSFNSPYHPLCSNYQVENINSLQPYFSKIVTIQSNQLAKLGGVLHCISWCY